MKTQPPFSLLPSQFLVLGLMLYLVVELLGALALDYIPMLSGHDQTMIIGMRLFETLGLVVLIRKFDVSATLGLSQPNMASIRIFIGFAALCTLGAAVLFFIKASWFAYIALPSWLYGAQGLFLMVVLAPVLEELVFRGLLYRMLRECWGVIASVAVSAILFSLVHHGIILSPQLVGGIIFALAYEYSRSLWVAIALHMGANSAVYLLSVLDFAK